MITRKSAIYLVLLAISGGAGAWADDPQVAIRLLETGQISGPHLRAAKEVAATVLATAGVQVQWQGRHAIHPATETIDIRFADSAPPSWKPGALAESFPFAHSGVRIIIFVDRISDYANRNPLFMPRILGHVLAHEIGHVLRGTTVHSSTGVMKARWDDDDFRTMRAKSLAFTPEDTLAIALHLAQSHARAAD